MKIWTSSHIFGHPWETVVQAAWRKYPNPINPAVSGIDVVDRKIGDDGVLRSTRVLRTEWKIPNWVTRLIGLENPSYAYEYSEVNRTNKQMVLETVNLNCTSFVTIEEKLVYQPHPEDPQQTMLEQSAVIKVRGIPLIDYMENLMASTINSNATKGRQALEWVIGRIQHEYGDLTNVISQEYNELSRKISHDYTELSTSAHRSMDELRRNLDELSHNIGTENKHFNPPGGAL